MKSTPELEQLMKEEMECDVLEGRGVEPGSVDKQIELALEMEAQEYQSLEEPDMEDDDVS